jgi:hypothetical protein
MAEKNWDKVFEREEAEAEANRIKINKMIAARDLNRPERFAHKKNKLLLDVTIIDYRIKNTKAELQQLYDKRTVLVRQVQQLEKDYVNGEPTI